MYGDNPPVTFGDSPLYTRGPKTDFLLRCPKFRSGICPRCAIRSATTYVLAERGTALKAACCIRHWQRFAAFPVVSADARPVWGRPLILNLRTFAASAAVPTKYTLTDKLYY